MTFIKTQVVALDAQATRYSYQLLDISGKVLKESHTICRASYAYGFDDAQKALAFDFDVQLTEAYNEAQDATIYAIKQCNAKMRAAFNSGSDWLKYKHQLDTLISSSNLFNNLTKGK